LKFFIKFIFYRIICILDTFVWLVINIINGKAIFNFAKERPWKVIALKKNSKFTKSLGKFINFFIKIRCYRNPILSSCLSRSITARLLLDILNIDNELYLGMTKDSQGNKIPHAWLKQKNNNYFITPGVSSKNSGVKLIKI
tara:strand:- start:1659 stop:2081 length:423 start_codon:yes stop_codon:yes gene_type:complete